MSEKRYQVFISSTFEDLQEERRAVSDTLLSVDCIPVGMEEFPATDEAQFDFIKKIIDESDYYLLIIGGRYGTVDDEGISFTEKEYSYAVSKNKTILSFIRAERNKLPCDKTDGDEDKKQKLENFIKEVSTGRLKKDWHNKDELKYLVSQSISHVKKTHPGIGYVKADFGDMENLLKQINGLTIENNELKKQLEELNCSKIEIPDLAGLNESYSFSGKIEDGTSQNISETWQNLFITLAANAMEGIDDAAAKNILSRHFKNKAGLKFFSLAEKSFNTIKIQMIALNLFDSDGFWQLTEKGKKTLILNAAIRQRKSS